LDAALDGAERRLDALLPRGDLWLDVTGVASREAGIGGRVELGAAHAFDNGLRLGGFLAGSADARDIKAEAGIRLTF
jgi:hypothetical protein